MAGVKSAVRAIRITQFLFRLGLILAIAGTLIFAGLHIFVNIAGKDLLTRKLEKTFKRKVTVGTVSALFPASLDVRNIQSKGLFSAAEVFAGAGLLDIFGEDFRLSKVIVIRPEVTLQKNFFAAAANVLVPLGTEKKSEAAESPKEAEKKDAPEPDLNVFSITHGRFLSSRFVIGSLIVNEGAVSYLDKLPDNREIAINVEHVNMKAENVNFGFTSSQVSTFELSGRIPWQKGSTVGKISLQGWINPKKNDMQAHLKIEDIDAVYLQPYYSSWINLEKARIEKAKLSFTSEISGLNNELTAQCHLELTDIVFKPRPPEEEEKKEEKIAAAVFGILKSLNQGKIALDFTIRTKMSKPIFGVGDIKSAFENKIVEGTRGQGIAVGDVVLFPARVVEGTVRGTAGVATAIIDGMFSVGKELGKALFGAFEKEKTK
ncbi:MAG: DUF748 domain-containing protein [Deltaproteobacteria bacterium]